MAGPATAPRKERTHPFPRRLGTGRTRVERAAARLTTEQLRAVGTDLLHGRQDASVPRTALAREAGLSPAQLWRIEQAIGQPSIESLSRVAVAPGGRISIRFYPETGPAIRDRHSAPMAETLVTVADRRWRRHPEVVVTRRVRGVVDLVLVDLDAALIVASEIESDMRRVEQEIRWANEKVEALRFTELCRVVSGTLGREPDVSQLLVLRSSERTRRLATDFGRLLATAYPARTADAVAALTTDDAPWPGSAVVWMNVEGGRARLLASAPRGVSLGR